MNAQNKCCIQSEEKGESCLCDQSLLKDFTNSCVGFVLRNLSLHSHFIMHNWCVDIPGCKGKFDLKHSHFVLKKQMTATTNSSIEKMISSHHFGGWVPAYMNGLCGSASLRLAFHCQGSQAGMISNSLCYYTLTNETRCFPCHRALVTSLSVMIFEI